MSDVLAKVVVWGIAFFLFIVVPVQIARRDRKRREEQREGWFWHQNSPECWFYVKKLEGVPQPVDESIPVVRAAHVDFVPAQDGIAAYWHVEVKTEAFDVEGCPAMRICYEVQASSLSHAQRIVEAIAPIRREAAALAAVLKDVPRVLS